VAQVMLDHSQVRFEIEQLDSELMRRPPSLYRNSWPVYGSLLNVGGTLEGTLSIGMSIGIDIPSYQTVSRLRALSSHIASHLLRGMMLEWRIRAM
jgi:hypothetical protein